MIDLGLEQFFDRVNHDRLLAAVAERVADKRIFKLIRAFMQAGVMEDGLVSPVGGWSTLTSERESRLICGLARVFWRLSTPSVLQGLEKVAMAPASLSGVEAMEARAHAVPRATQTGGYKDLACGPACTVV